MRSAQTGEGGFCLEVLRHLLCNSGTDISWGSETGFHIPRFHRARGRAGAPATVQPRPARLQRSGADHWIREHRAVSVRHNAVLYRVYRTSRAPESRGNMTVGGR